MKSLWKWLALVAALAAANYAGYAFGLKAHDKMMKQLLDGLVITHSALETTQSVNLARGLRQGMSDRVLERLEMEIDSSLSHLSEPYLDHSYGYDTAQSSVSFARKYRSDYPGHKPSEYWAKGVERTFALFPEVTSNNASSPKLPSPATAQTDSTHSQ